MSRPKLPRGVERALWSLSAGRCQFRGCNRPVFLDPLTRATSNVGRISHIVSYEPGGPRGDPLLSPRLAKDLTNLMLTCGDHSKVIDDRERVAEYPVERLQAFKREHEDRVRALTEVQAEAKSEVVILKAAVNTRIPEILADDAFRAMLPLYPAQERPRVIDLRSNRNRLEDGDLTTMSRDLAQELRRRPIGEAEASVAVFALAPIPILIDFGSHLGDLGRVHLFQRHRSPVEGWAWPATEDVDGEFYELRRPPFRESAEVTLILAVSACVEVELLPPHAGSLPRYELRAREPGKDFLVSAARLKAFGVSLRHMLAEVASRHPGLERVHLFAAVPAPVAVEFGRHLHGMDAPVAVYEFNEPKRCYDASLLVDRHRADT